MSQLWEVQEPSGVYQILCRRTGQKYVGSSLDIDQRWKTHRRQLNQRTHCNQYLQRAWTKYGEPRFEFRVLELINAKRLRRSEESWIERLRTTDRRLGFNVNRRATGGFHNSGRTWIGFRNPRGTSVTIVNLHDFCRRKNLDFPSMHRLSQGKSKLKSYKGWTHVKSVRVRDFIKVHRGYVAPNGTRVGPIRNLAAFCREHGLDDTHMVAVAMGRIVSHRGWTHVRGRVKLLPLVHRGFIAPDGTPTPITNLAAFCRANGLSVVHMHNVKGGNRPSHKGWTWRKPHIRTAMDRQSTRTASSVRRVRT